MLESILNFLLPKPKSMLDYAINDINKSNKVMSISGNITNGKIFLVGSRKTNDRYSGSVRFDCFNIIFSKDDKEVMIKKDNEVVYFFNNPNDIKSIRDTIVARSQSL